MRFLPDALHDLLQRRFAASCVVCDQAGEFARVCEPCRRMLPWNDTFCERCGQPMTGIQPAAVACASCQAKPPPFDKARAPLIYDFPVDGMLKAIKFKRQLWYVPALAALLQESLEREFPVVDSLVPVPLHRWRQMRRGFNQAIELCRPLHAWTALPILIQPKRIRATAAQTGLSASQRRRNLQGAFRVPGKLPGLHPLIIDDVITTGETCSELATELLRAGAESVGVLTVARAYAGVAGSKV